MNNSSWSFWNPKSYCSPDPASTGEPADWPNAGDMECWLLRDVCCQLLVWTDSSRPFCTWPITLRPALESIAERDPGDVGWPEAQICSGKRRLMLLHGRSRDKTSWMMLDVTWTSQLDSLHEVFEFRSCFRIWDWGNLANQTWIKEGTAKSRRRSGRSELDPWNFSKVERCWKADKIWEVQKASAKCKLPGLCICRWHQHMQLARPAFCQKTQNSAGTWLSNMSGCWNTLCKMIPTPTLSVFTRQLFWPFLTSETETMSMPWGKQWCCDKKMSWSLADLLDLVRS